MRVRRLVVDNVKSPNLAARTHCTINQRAGAYGMRYMVLLTANASVLDLDVTQAIEFLLITIGHETKGVEESKRRLSSEFVFELCNDLKKQWGVSECIPISVGGALEAPTRSIDRDPYKESSHNTYGVQGRGGSSLLGGRSKGGSRGNKGGDDGGLHGVNFRKNDKV